LLFFGQFKNSVATALQRLPDDNHRHHRLDGRQARSRSDALCPIPYWWNMSLKEMKLATFNARVETAETKPMFRVGPVLKCVVKSCAGVG
jgi:putative SOS response-associated peptidase YedK